MTTPRQEPHRPPWWRQSRPPWAELDAHYEAGFAAGRNMRLAAMLALACAGALGGVLLSVAILTYAGVVT